MELNAYWLALMTSWKMLLGAVVLSIAAASALTWPITSQHVASTSLFVAMEPGSDNLNELYRRSAMAESSLQQVGTTTALWQWLSSPLPPVSI